jgi:ATP-dependent DNA helicase RecG
MYEERLRAAKPEKFAWERQETEGLALADLDEKRISGAVRLGVERGRMPATAEAESVESLLSKWNLMRDGKVLNGAVALFGKNLSGYTQMSLRLARFRGTDKNEFVDSGRADGNFFDLLDAGMAFLFKHLSQSGKIVGFQKEEHLEIPAEALREALTNALCHRQLEKYNLTPSIAVYDDRVEIENPGRLPFDLTPETIKSAHASYPYNPLIAEVLFKSSFLESWGSGVGRMVDACRAQGVPEPEYEVAGGFVRIVFKRPIIIGSDGDDRRNGYVNGEVNGYVNGEVNTLTPSQKLVYDTVNNNPGIQTKQIADVLKRSPRTIEKHLAFWAKSCFIEHRDSDKTGGYYVKKADV